ncbi:AAA family ATPase [Terrilactibacillus sp. S3-3]|nr:AAA family ATPase [Terrilactibacillus sp. S3-3]
MVKNYALENYNVFIHLPIEFPLVRDGHRPQSESFRKLCDDLLIKKTIKELGIKYYVVHGTLENRLKQIVSLLNLKCLMDVDEAIRIAQERVKSSLSTHQGGHLMKALFDKLSVFFDESAVSNLASLYYCHYFWWLFRVKSHTSFKRRRMGCHPFTVT